MTKSKKNSDKSEARFKWKTRTVGDCFNLINGRSFKQEDWKSEGLPIIRIQNLNSTNSEFNYYQGDYDERYIVENGDLLFAWAGTKEVSFGARIWSGEKALLNQHIFKVIRKNDHILKGFDYYLLLEAQELIERSAHGFKSTFVHVPKSILEKVKVCIPPIQEQKAIAHILGLMDNAIHTNNQLVAQKELRKKWLMQQLLTGKKRLKGFSEDWKEMHIRDVAKEVSIRNKSDKQLTVLSCTKYDGLVPSLEYFGRKIFSDDVSTYKVVPKNHFAYATNHIEEGSIGYQDTMDEALISPMYTVFKTNSSINNSFFYRLLKSHKLIYQYQNRMEGSIDRRGGLRWEAFSIIKINVPPYEEQMAINRVLQAVDKEIQLLKLKTEKLKEKKKGLMQVLLTGKKRLNIK